MDQGSFRRILESGSGSSSSRQPKAQRVRGSSRSRQCRSFVACDNRRKTVDASEPAFKPRKVKKSEGKYRDRAADRRVGEGNDYAQVEAVLEDFGKRLGEQRGTSFYRRNSQVTDEQRKYLGGDSSHSILVKGLDVALLEQNKAKASLSTVDDDSLEQAFKEAVAETTVPKKRNREDMIRELKEKRGITSSTPTPDAALEAVKKQGKKKNVKADGTDGERKKKKRRVEAVEPKGDDDRKAMPSPPLPSNGAQSAPTASPSIPLPLEDDAPDDFDILAGAGEYEGIDLGDEEEEEEDKETGKHDNRDLEVGEEAELAPRKWFEEHEPEPLPSTSKLLLPLPSATSKPPSHPVDEGLDEDGEAHNLLD
ncbi:hypothetical protein C8R47DRAFT_1196993 [Mycena vitilis]|nr:hypothetical protein C8R47DRAFT_1196993 [Mycena vitilis]